MILHRMAARHWIAVALIAVVAIAAFLLAWDFQ